MSGLIGLNAPILSVPKFNVGTELKPIINRKSTDNYTDNAASDKKLTQVTKEEGSDLRDQQVDISQDQKIVRSGGLEYNIPQSLKKWDPTEIATKFKHITGFIYGKRGTGKTVALKHFCYENRKAWDEVHLFSGTAKFQKDVFDFIPEDNIHDGFDEGTLIDIVAEQKQYVEHMIKNKQEKYIKTILLLFDDVISDERVRSSPTFTALFTLGRHVRLSTIIITQEMGGRSGIPKVIRGNCDFVILFFPHNEVDRESIVDQYLSTIHSKVGDLILKNATMKEFTSLVVHSREPSRFYEDYCFVHKAPEKVRSFMIGSRYLKKSKDPMNNASVRSIPQVYGIQRGLLHIPIEESTTAGLDYISRFDL